MASLFGSCHCKLRDKKGAKKKRFINVNVNADVTVSKTDVFNTGNITPEQKELKV